MRLVTLSPSVPASGQSLTMNDMVTVGGSMGWAWIGMSFSGAREGVGHRALHEARDGHDVARLADLDRLALEAAEGEDLGHAAGLDHACPRGRAP